MVLFYFDFCPKKRAGKDYRVGFQKGGTLFFKGHLLAKKGTSPGRGFWTLIEGEEG
jgi:hypothetical protein